MASLKQDGSVSEIITFYPLFFFSLKRSGYALSSVCFLCESLIRGEIHFAPNFVVRASLDRFL